MPESKDNDLLEWFYFGLPLAGFVLFWFVFGDKILGRNQLPRRDPADMPPAKVDPKDYIYLTKEEMAEFNGKDRADKKIYLAVKNDIFDVSKNPGMYGWDGAYGVFAGREVSVAMAKNSTDMKDVEADYKTTKLNVSYQDSLESWYSFFERKYALIGQIKENKKDK